MCPALVKSISEFLTCNKSLKELNYHELSSKFPIILNSLKNNKTLEKITIKFSLDTVNTFIDMLNINTSLKEIRIQKEPFKTFILDSMVNYNNNLIQIINQVRNGKVKRSLLLKESLYTKQIV